MIQAQTQSHEIRCGVIFSHNFYICQKFFFSKLLSKSTRLITHYFHSNKLYCTGHRFCYTNEDVLRYIAKMIFLIVYLLIAFANGQYCDKENCFEGLSCDRIISKSRKKTTINLVSIDEDENEEWKLPEVPKIFFIESSGRDHLLPRQACTVESAIKNSGIQTVIIAMTSKGAS
jgi:hypothetical protein